MDECDRIIAHYDVIIIGGGPAGLSAALLLGRSVRRVLVCDSGQPRNRASRAAHGFLTRDGIPPQELLRLGREEVARYGVEFREGEVVQACCVRGSSCTVESTLFEIVMDEGSRFSARKLLLATGVSDIVPEVPGFSEYYGRFVHHCPYCDGWEHRGRRLVAYGTARAAVGLALSLRNWSARVTVCCDGDEVSAVDAERLRRCGIAVRSDRVVRLEGADGVLKRVVFEGAHTLECDALFFNTAQIQRSPLPESLGCRFKNDVHVVTSQRQGSPVPGLFLAGDIDGDAQFLIVAAAEGAQAAVTINRELQEEDRGEGDEGRRAASGL